tara:strand:+ start:1526 stop:1816 length:291 start_codon:yes stop_codon:yes gene_type:complete
MQNSSNQISLFDQHHPNPKFMDRFIKITDAARILGYASFQSINQMIKNHALNSYSLPETTRPRVLLSEILALKQNQKLVPQGVNYKARGRPRKIKF